jgi:hypothetical protein
MPKNADVLENVIADIVAVQSAGSPMAYTLAVPR